jgi:hypothetical protein
MTNKSNDILGAFIIMLIALAIVLLYYFGAKQLSNNAPTPTRYEPDSNYIKYIN